MQIDTIEQKALLLFQQQRFKEAQKEFESLISINPLNGFSFSMLALCHLSLKNLDKAQEYATTAIGLSADNPYSYYVAAYVSFANEELEKAEEWIDSAIGLNPYEADYFALKANIFITRKEWKTAFEYANKGLAIDPENISCLNIRSSAQVKLNDKDGAYQTIKEALNYNPENSYTHANLGWGLLEKGDHENSLEHFKQALALDADNDWAKSGLVEALKAKYFLYRLFLKYAFWIGNMKEKAQWGIIIGFYIGSKVLRVIGSLYPELSFITMPLIILYSIFALTTWLIQPISDLFLRLNVYGRYALSEQQIECSNIIAVFLLISILSGVSYLLFPYDYFLMICLLGFSMCLPIAALYRNDKGSKGWKVIGAYSIALLFIGLLAIFLNMSGGDFNNPFTSIYLLGFIIFQWVGNAYAIK